MPAPRPKVRPTMGLHNLGKGGPKEGHYVSMCKVCRRGIYRDQPHRWFLAAPIGISHDACRPAEATA